jgi:glyoxylase-like metal-dependent hydrolase (beta-lactamase superfamily II)
MLASMLRRALRLAAALLAALLALAAAALLVAHAGVRGLGGPLPDAPPAPPAGAALPVRVLVINTATQRVPRRQVLDPARDPAPERPYALGHPAFLLAWEDGRRLLVDVGMDREAAAAFGRPLELVGAGPIEPHGGVAERLGGELASGPLAVVFTHLHADHTQGLRALCALRRGAPVDVLQTPAQATRRTYTTRPGAGHLEQAGCARPSVLPEAPLAGLPGHPGVGVVWAAGHTPDSQIVLASLRGPDGALRRIAFAGDAANAIDGIRAGVPKPRLYRLLVVPEDEARLDRVRRFLAGLEAAGFAIAPSHDLLHLRSLGLPFAGEAR